jgi:peptidoglycan-associated lipoprotein
MDRRSVCNLFTTFGRSALVGLLVMGGAAACGSKAKQPTTVSTDKPAGDSKDDNIRDVAVTPAKPGDPVPPKEPIYFDFDSYQVAEPSKAKLDKIADYLKSNPGSNVTISGHTDERGTTEYNLMLGDQRAKAAHDYLVRSGIDPLRIKTISFGEERPAVPGTTEDAYQQNRRDEFNTSQAPK